MKYILMMLVMEMVTVIDFRKEVALDELVSMASVNGSVYFLGVQVMIIG